MQMLKCFKLRLSSAPQQKNKNKERRQMCERGRGRAGQCGRSLLQQNYMQAQIF